MNMKCLMTLVLVMASRLLLFAQSDVTNELITNPGFESGINNGWSLVVDDGAANFTDAGSSESVSGNSAGKVEVTTAPSGGSAVLKIYLENELKDATAYVGKTLTYSFKAKASWTYAGSGFTKIMPRVDDQNGNNLASIEKWFTGSNEDLYQDVTVSVNVPAGTTQLRFYIWLGAYKSAFTFDDFTVTCAECQGTPKLDQTITFSSLEDKQVGDPSFDLTATASSMLAVTYSSSNASVATVSGNTVTVVGEGTTTITASQAGDAMYNAAPDVTQILTVNDTVTTPPPTDGIAKVEAESATKSGDISFNQGWRMDNPSNGDCAYFNDGNGSYLQFTANVSQSGSYALPIVYSAVNASAVSKLVVNGTEVETIAWPYTGGNFKTTLNYSTNVSLNAGSNTIQILHDAGWLCIDYFGDPDNVITFTLNPSTVDIDDPDFMLTASSSIGEDITFTSSNPSVASISGSTVSIVAEGTTTITANSVGATPVSHQLVVTGDEGPVSQTITLDATASKCSTVNTYTLPATATSGLTIAYASLNQNVATVSGNTVTIVGVGTATITANQAGNAMYYPAEEKTQTLTVSNCPEGNFWTKSMKGVNQDASIPTGENYEKVQHEAAHMQTISEAGFESVRFFIAYASADFTAHRQRIQDALDNNLAVIICMWGPGNWYSSNNAETEIGDRWQAIAEWVDQEFPGSENSIGFELLNETGAIGFPQTAAGHLKSMKLYGAAANAVRAVNATRPIMISPSGWQDADLLSYVTVANVGYDFTNDPNCGMSVHFYKPSSGSIGWYAMNEYPLLNPSGDEWRAQVRAEVDHVLDWRNAKGVQNMPVVVTEWGCWSFPEREARGDLALTVNYHMELFRQHNIGSTWYTGIQNNQRAFGIFDSEFGWNNTVVQAITGQSAPATWPATNQFIGTEFEDFIAKTWKRLDDSEHVRVQYDDALSGNTSLRLAAPVTIYQRSFVGKVSSGLEVGENLETRLGKYMLHLVQGKTYKISFLAKSESGTSQLVFRFKENQSSANGNTIINQTGATYYTSPTKSIGGTAQRYEFTYTHNMATAMDVWAEFEVTSGSIIFDAADCRQTDGSGPVGPYEQNITFGSLTDKCHYSSAFELSGSADSGLPVSYTSSNTSVATVSGTTVTIVGEGSTNITASQAGNSEYLAADNVSQTLTVNNCPESTGIWAKMLKGVNQDANSGPGGNFEKVNHEYGHMETMRDAGFESVRFFTAYEGGDFRGHKQRILDAFDNDLAVILCLWGPQNWYNNSNAETQMYDYWQELAQWAEQEFPNSDDKLVFELLNETGAINFPQTEEGHLQSMKLYGEGAKAVRSVSATRPIMISPSGWQDAHLMDYVTVQNMGYDFKQDPNCGMSIHFYKPNSGDVGWFAMNEYPLLDQSSDAWRKQIRDEIDYVLDWKSAQGVPNMKVVVTEWGCWSFPDREENGDLKLVVDYHMDYFKEHNIGSTWYTGLQNNQRAFAIFDSETGWNDIVVKGITGQNAPSTWPATNQFLGIEFEDWGSKTWKRLDGASHQRVQFLDALSGNSSIVLSAPSTIYQRSFVGLVSSGLEVGENMETRLGKALLHLMQGKTYKISFMAKAHDESATVKFSMKENLSSADGNTIINSTGSTHFTSNSINIGTTPQTYEITYTHNAATAWDVWAQFEVTSGTITFDAVDFRQTGGTISNAREISDLSLENTLEEMLVYPNPSSQIVNIRNLKVGAPLQVINAVGKVVFAEEVKSEQITIDVSKLNKGIYFIRSEASTSKLIVE